MTNTTEHVRDGEPSVPESQLGQPARQIRDVSDAERELLREQHGYVRAYFLGRAERFQRLQQSLNQARIGQTYDVYMARSVYYALLVGVVGALVGLAATVWLSSQGVFTTLSSPIGVNPLTRFIALHRVLVGGLALTAGGAACSGVAVFLARAYYPPYAAASRRRSIDIHLPHAVVYMYALSSGGMNLTEVFKELSESEDVYGGVATEFDGVVRDVELFGNDVLTALRHARNLTPSSSFEQFLDDAISVLDSGGDFPQFLEQESEQYLREAKQEQQNFLDTLSLLSEVFIVAFVATPLFLVVTLLVVSLLGGSMLTQASLVVYTVFPLGMAGFLVLIDVVSTPYGDQAVDIDVTDGRVQTTEDDRAVREQAQSHPDFEEYEREKLRGWLVDFFLDEPVERLLSTNPLYSLLVTAPAGLLTFASVVTTGLADPSIAAMTVRPVAATVWLVVVPILVVFLPLMVLHELRRRRERHIAERFPDTLNVISTANEMGLPLTDSLTLVARWSEGRLADEFCKVRNDITWNFDVQRALLRFADRVKVPQVTRTMNLIAKGSRSRSDLSDVISIAAEDNHNRHQLGVKRRQEMKSYTVIVVIGFLVYMGVVVLLDTSYLQPISEFGGQMDEGADATSMLSVSDVPVKTYRAMFYHSTLIQGFGSGLLAGKLSDDSVLSGLKYSIALVLVSTVTFLVL